VVAGLVPVGVNGGSLVHPVREAAPKRSDGRVRHDTQGPWSGTNGGDP